MNRVEAATAREMGDAGSYPELFEPDVGWHDGLMRLIGGRCAWCGQPLTEVQLDPIAGLTWKCLESCNRVTIERVKANQRATYVATSLVRGWIDHWRSVEGAYYDQTPRLRVEPGQVITCEWNSGCKPVAIIHTDGETEHQLAFNEPEG